MKLPKPGLGVYILAGWPSAEIYGEVLATVAQVADFVELGLPSKMPKYDGPYIRKVHAEAQPAPIKAPSVPTFIMAYWEDYAERPEELFDTARRASAAGVLAPDLLIDYPGDLEKYVKLSEVFGLNTAFFLPSKFPHWLARRLASYSPAFIYLGLYAATGIELPVYVERNIATIREVAPDVYIVAGFAIDRAEKAVKIIKAGADAVVVGTAFMRRLKNSLEEAIGFLKELKSALS